MVVSWHTDRIVGSRNSKLEKFPMQSSGAGKDDEEFCDGSPRIVEAKNGSLAVQIQGKCGSKRRAQKTMIPNRTKFSFSGHPSKAKMRLPYRRGAIFEKNRVFKLKSKK